MIDNAGYLASVLRERVAAFSDAEACAALALLLAEAAARVPVEQAAGVCLGLVRVAGGLAERIEAQQRPHAG